MIASILEDFLHGVQVKHERICLYHLHCPFALLKSETII